MLIVGGVLIAGLFLFLFLASLTVGKSQVEMKGCTYRAGVHAKRKFLCSRWRVTKDFGTTIVLRGLRPDGSLFSTIPAGTTTMVITKDELEQLIRDGDLVFLQRFHGVQC